MRIETPSRLHFTLIDLNGSLGRIDGSVGAALEYPNWIINVEASEKLEVKVSGEARPAEIKKLILKFSRRYGIEPNFYVEVSGGIPRHIGLGSTTQLALGVAYALAKISGVDASLRELAYAMGRGGTSGIGVAAFEAGGVIVDGGHSFGPKKHKKTFLPSRYSRAPPPPVLARYYPPKDWLWVVVAPLGYRGAHGHREAEIFRRSCPISEAEVEKLSRIILMKLMPALAEFDIESFGESLNSLQTLGFKKLEVRLAGRLPRKLMELMREQGAYGAGLSSFGPAVYGLTLGRKKAENLAKASRELLEAENQPYTVFYSETNREGAKVSA